MATYRIWFPEYPEDGVQWEGEADSLEDAKAKALYAWGDPYTTAEHIDGCDATGLPPLVDEYGAEVAS